MIDPIKIEGTLYYNDDCKNCPVKSPKSKLNDSLYLTYPLECGRDNACLTDLRLYVNTNLYFNEKNNDFYYNYVIGSKTNVDLVIVVENLREPAYGAQSIIFIPEPLDLIRLPSECEEKRIYNESLVIACDLGNPLRRNVSEFLIFFIFINIPMQFNI